MKISLDLFPILLFFAAYKGRQRRLFLHGAVPDALKDAARAAGLEVRGRERGGSKWGVQGGDTPWLCRD